MIPILLALVAASAARVLAVSTVAETRGILQDDLSCYSCRRGFLLDSGRSVLVGVLDVAQGGFFAIWKRCTTFSPWTLVGFVGWNGGNKEQGFSTGKK